MTIIASVDRFLLLTGFEHLKWFVLNPVNYVEKILILFDTTFAHVKEYVQHVNGIVIHLHLNSQVFSSQLLRTLATTR